MIDSDSSPIGNETRFRIVNFLTEENAKSAKELEEGLALPSNTLHYHLDVLVGVGLVENRKGKIRIRTASTRIIKSRRSEKGSSKRAFVS